MTLAAFLVAVTLCVSADEISDSRNLQKEAFAAYKAKDYATFLAKIAAASDLRPGQSTILYYRAAALALNGKRDESLDALERIARMGMVFDAEHEEDFASLHESPRWQPVIDTFKRNAAPIGVAETAFTIPERGIISEGLAWDPVSKTYFVSSVRHGSIWKMRNGKAQPYIIGLPWGVWGMVVDSKRRILWAAQGVLPQNEKFRESDQDHGAVLKIDLKSGRVLKTIRPTDNGKHLFDDLAIGENGVVYVSDSVSPSIYIVRDDKLEPFVENGPFGNMNGIAAGPNVLYVSDYLRGIATVDLATRDVRYLVPPDDATLIGIDGLYRAGPRTLIATQNGTNPQRVIRIDLDGQKISRVTTLAANQPNMPDITLGVLAGSAFYFNGAGQWDQFDDAGKVKDPTKLVPATVVRVRY